MDWPAVRFPVPMTAGSVSVRPYDPADAVELFEALADERVWEHMSRPVPSDAASLSEVIGSRLAGACRATFTVRQAGRAVGVTSVDFNLREPAGVESAVRSSIRACGGTGVNAAVKRLLLGVIFRNGAQWVRLCTDERNRRSAAAIRKLGATDLGVVNEDVVRRDGTLQRSRIFRIDRPEN